MRVEFREPQTEITELKSRTENSVEDFNIRATK